MAEFSCSYCYACPRHGCEDTEEASRCPNNDNKGATLGYDRRDVANWLRYEAQGDPAADILIAAAEILEN